VRVVERERGREEGALAAEEGAKVAAVAVQDEIVSIFGNGGAVRGCAVERGVRGERHAVER
jgi:hypothetical protein